MGMVVCRICLSCWNDWHRIVALLCIVCRQRTLELCHRISASSQSWRSTCSFKNRSQLCTCLIIEIVSWTTVLLSSVSGLSCCAHWRHLLNTIEWSVCGSGVALCKLALATLSSNRQHLSHGGCLEERANIVTTAVCCVLYDSCAQRYAHKYQLFLNLHLVIRLD